MPPLSKGQTDTGQCPDKGLLRKRTVVWAYSHSSWLTDKITSKVIKAWILNGCPFTNFNTWTYFYCLFNAVMPKGKEAWEENKSFLYICTKAKEYQHLILAAGRQKATWEHLVHIITCFKHFLALSAEILCKSIANLQ